MTFHKGLRAAKFIPPLTFGPRLSGLLRKAPARSPKGPPDVSIEVITAPGVWGAPPVELRVYRPAEPAPAAPAVLWFHGGGFVLGHPSADDGLNVDIVRTIGATVVGVRYRLAPDHQAAQTLDDAYSGLAWLFQNAESLGVDPARIAAAGASAGAGLAAALILLAHDRDEYRLAFQSLVYPMLDDRTVLRQDMDLRNVRVWTAKSNRFAWQAHLGTAPGSADVPDYHAPARRVDLSGLPPAWIGVGTYDLFYDEDVTYAHRLREAGVECELRVVDGAFHAFDVIFGMAKVSKAFTAQQIDALRGALTVGA